MTTIEDVALPAAALPAWQAYRRVLDTKAAHFAALEQGERDARGGVGSRLAQQAHLAALLDEHSRAVAAFKAAMQSLAATDTAARDALIAALARINDTLLPAGEAKGH